MKKELLLYSEIKKHNIIKTFNEVALKNLSNVLLDIIKSVSHIYPAAQEWFVHKVIPDLENSNGNRDILFLFVYNDNNEKILAGLAILKKDIYEKKICTFHIKKEFRRNGLGNYLMDACIKFLGTTSPMITIAKSRIIPNDNNYLSFINFFNKYYPNQFKCLQKLKDYYRDEYDEYVFNGKLPKISQNKIKTIKIHLI